MAARNPAAITGLCSLLGRSRPEGDGALLRRFAGDRDESAFAELLRRHGPMVLALCRRVAGDSHAAEDLFQATFLILARKAGSVRRPESLAAWLHGTALRLALRARRSERRRQERESGAPARRSPNPLDELTARELLQVLDAELHRLPEAYRLPLILCGLEGRSQEEAARRLAWSPGSVKGRLERGRARLRERLRRRGLALPEALAGPLLLGATEAVPEALARSTVNAALPDGAVSPAVQALVQGAVQSMFLAKLKAVGVVTLAAGLLAAGVGLTATQPPAAGREPVAPTARDDDSAARPGDPSGDRLPEGAVARLGSDLRRAAGAKLAFGADGRSIIGVRYGGYTLWDAATGRPRERRELTTKWGIGIPSPNGRWVVTGGPRKGTLSVWDVETGKRVGDPLAFEPRQPGRGVPAPSSIRPVVFSPDGKLLAAVGMAVPDHRVRVWDAATGRQLFAEDLAFDSMFSDELVFSPDGKHLLASFGTSRGGTFCWDISAGKRLWQVTEFSPSSMVVTADGKILSPVPGREALDLATGEPLKDVALPPMKLGDRLTITPDGRTLFVDAKEGVTAWDLARGKVLHTWKGMRGELIPSPDGKTLLVHDGAFRRWDLTTGKPLDPDTFDDGHTREVVAVAFAAGGKWLASASKDGSVRLWHDPRTGKPFRTWRAHEPWAWHRVSMGEPCGLGATALDITPDGRFVASGGADGLKVWDAAGGKLVRSIPLPEKKHWEIDPHVMRARLAPGGESAVAVFGAESAGFAVGPGDDLNALPTLTNTIARRDVKTGAMLGQHTIAPAPTPERDLSPDGRLLLSRGVIIDTVTGKEVSRLRSTDGTGGTSAPRPLPSIFSPDGMSIAGELYEVKDNASRRAGLHVWEAATGKVVARVGTHKRSRYPTNQVALHPLLPLAATSTSFDELSVWDLRTGEIVGTLRMPEETHGGASCLAFSPDGKLLATGHPDGTILLWPVPLPQRKPEPLAKDELESLWADLRDADAARAWRAVWRMAEVPGDAIPFLRERLKPVQPVAEKVTRPLVADLGSDSFRRREAAAKRLCELGARAEPALREVLKGNPPAEVRQRVEALLRAVTEAPTALTPEELRALRAVAALARIEAREAGAILKALAEGLPSARVTLAAKAAVANRAAGSD